MNKALSESNETLGTYDAFAQVYHSAHAHIADMQDLSDIFIHMLSGKKVLDIGCGPGRDAKYFTEQGLEVTGIDMSKNLLSIARQQAPLATFALMDMGDLEFKPHSFDGLRVCASFLHIPKAQANQVLNGFKKILKSGGLLYISVKHGTGEKRVTNTKYGTSPRFFAFYDAQEFEEMLTYSNFSIMKHIEMLKNGATWHHFFAVND